MFSFFNSLIVLLAILRVKVFGTGLLIYLPWASVGFFIEMYFELILNPVLINIWGVIGWCLFGLLTGLSADLSYWYLRKKTSLKEKYTASITAMIMSLVFFILNVIASIFFYKNGMANLNFSPSTFLGNAYFGIPWMIINSLFGGYVAYNLNKDLTKNS